MRPTVWMICGILFLASPLAAQQAIGIFEGWGAFRMGSQCYAIARPSRVAGQEVGQAYVSFRFSKGSARFYAQLSRSRRPDTSLTITLGGRRFLLTASDRDAVAPDPATDRAILAALRMANVMSIEGSDRRGRSIVDAYALDGAPSALDAARLACLTG